jgi:hypothetical protein
MDTDKHRYQTMIPGIYLLCCIKKSHMRANDFPMKQLHQTVFNREWTRINANDSAGMGFIRGWKMRDSGSRMGFRSKGGNFYGQNG